MNIYKFITQKTHSINYLNHNFLSKNKSSEIYILRNTLITTKKYSFCVTSMDFSLKRNSVCIIVNKIPPVNSKYAVSLSIFAEIQKLCLRLVYWEQDI